MRFDTTVLAPDPERRRALIEMLEAALDAVDPGRAVAASLSRDGRTVQVAGSLIEVPGSVLVLAVGKAAPAMARAACRALEGLRLQGLVVADHEEEFPPSLRMHVAGHPLPDDRSLTAGRAALELVEAAGPGDLVLFLVSGGGSSLLEAPAGDLTLEDLRSAQRLMLRQGLPIGDMNTIRRHLSAVKGGRLAGAAGPATEMATLLVSDVVGPPDVIASGPTLPDPTTFEDALAVVERHGLGAELPPAVLAHLESGAAGRRQETPKRLRSL
ncbi:MAG: DUF4147 domain-containing protein, partial [Acidimicrobiia bacterium]